MTTPVPSPCVSVCMLDEQDICTGCQRSGQEIIQWGRMNDAERRAVLARCEQRARDQGLLFEPASQQGTSV
ncbi:DUF1289 domain-containing protein [Pseudomonas sp. WN033]|nr:DUF1289 domain-containing protein [Pseudomonas sp. WN033]